MIHACQKELASLAKEALESRDFETLSFERHCFDIVARNSDRLILVKVLSNIDSFTPEQAKDLQNISCAIRASPVIVSSHGRNFAMDDGHVYERFGIPAISMSTFTSMLDGESPTRFSRKGKVTQSICSESLRNLRASHGLSLERLAGEVGISKKTLYFAEKHSCIGPEFAERLERFLGESIMRDIDLFSWELSAGKCDIDDSFEMELAESIGRAGFECFTFRTAPVGVVGSSEDGIILSHIERARLREHQAESLRELSSLCLHEKMIVRQSARKSSYGGIAMIGLDELKSAGCREEIVNMIHERERI